MVNRLFVEDDSPPCQAGQLVVKIGGPAYRIGVGGGAASSMVAGDNQVGGACMAPVVGGDWGQQKRSRGAGLFQRLGNSKFRRNCGEMFDKIPNPV